MSAFLLTPFSSVLLLVGVVLIIAMIYTGSQRKKLNTRRKSISEDVEQAIKFIPGPTPLPIIGNILSMSKYEKNPYEGFTKLSHKYGPVYKMQMGATPCVVVSSLDSIMEVLIKKGQSFDGRPDFLRWNTYFDGDRQHSLALCDWSDIQQTRRNVVRAHLMLKKENHKNDLEVCSSSEIEVLLSEVAKNENKEYTVKPTLSLFAMNIFMQYMCSSNFDYNDQEFKDITKCFDLIFEDINNGHPTDFLPWLAPFFNSYDKNVKNLAEKIREFILRRVIRDRADDFDGNNIYDLVDALLSNHLSHGNGKLNLDWQNILFALEDLLGGSSAISNVVMRVLGFVAKNPPVQERIQREIDENIEENRVPTDNDRKSLKFLEATILETLRHTSSPIVPHVANENSSVGGYFIEKGTVMIINNYHLNLSNKLWKNAAKFEPERFIVNDEIKKPAHFLPFSTGKRSCIGSKILMNLTFVALAALLQKYDVRIPKNTEVHMPPARLALIGDGFPFIFSPRQRK